MTERIALHVFVVGRVQGVWYRGWAEETARHLGLDGWIRNLRDGRVEAVFAGPRDIVERMVDACWGGPPLARVEAVSHVPAAMPTEPGFHRLPTI